MSRGGPKPKNKVWLASYPRSGNTLLRMILHAAFGVSTWSEYGDEFRHHPEVRQFTGAIDDHAKYVKTHNREADLYPGQAIYVRRDWDEVEESMKALGVNPCGPWGNDHPAHVAAWANRPETLYLEFNQLKSAGTRRQLAKFLQLEDSGGQIPDFGKLHRLNPRHFRQAGFA